MDYTITHSLNNDENRWDVTLTGEFDIFNAQELKTKLVDLSIDNSIDIYIDCEKVSFLDSTAMGSLVAALKSVKAYNGKITLAHLKPGIHRLFTITNLDRVFEIAGDTDGK